MENQTSSQANQPTSLDLEQFKSLYQQFDDTTLARLAEVYSNHIEFKDPIHHLTGLKALAGYFSSFCQPDIQCRFEFNEQIAAPNQAFIHWTMHYSHARIRGGKTQKLEGASLIKFNDKIFFHQDFYDMGAMVYQHIPLIGWAVRKINARITGKHS